MSEERRRRMNERYSQLTHTFTLQSQPYPKVSYKNVWNVVQDILRMGRN